MKFGDYCKLFVKFLDVSGWQNFPKLGFMASLCTSSGVKGLSAAGRAEKGLTTGKVAGVSDWGYLSSRLSPLNSIFSSFFPLPARLITRESVHRIF